LPLIPRTRLIQTLETRNPRQVLRWMRLTSGSVVLAGWALTSRRNTITAIVRAARLPPNGAHNSATYHPNDHIETTIARDPRIPAWPRRSPLSPPTAPRTSARHPHQRRHPTSPVEPPGPGIATATTTAGQLQGPGAPSVSPVRFLPRKHLPSRCRLPKRGRRPSRALAASPEVPARAAGGWWRGSSAGSVETVGYGRTQKRRSPPPEPSFMPLP
jgi:hypothetical protein